LHLVLAFNRFILKFLICSYSSPICNKC